MLTGCSREVGLIPTSIYRQCQGPNLSRQYDYNNIDINGFLVEYILCDTVCDAAIACHWMTLIIL